MSESNVERMYDKKNEYVNKSGEHTNEIEKKEIERKEKRKKSE